MIRKIDEKDFQRIYELGTKYDSNFSEKYPLDEYVDKDIYLLKCFYEDDIIKGFIIGTNIQDDVDVLLVYVDNEYRNNKIGYNLMKSFEETSNVKNIFLEVSVLNKYAIKLYKSLGYEIIDIRKAYYDKIDAYVMKKVVK